MKNILVVGGAGYIGGLTVDLLDKAGYRTTVYDKLLYESRYLKKTNFIYGDIRDTKQLLKIHKNFDEIIWLAAIVGDGACQQYPKLTREVNVDSIKNFLKYAKRRIIFTSTCSVYGAQKNLLNEDSPINPLSIYAETKLEAEKYVLDNNGLVFRLGTLFGLGDNYSRIRLDLVVNVMTLTACRKNKLTVFGGDQWRPLLAVHDIASYLKEAVEKKNLSGIYNLKYKNYRMSKLAEEIIGNFKGAKVQFSKMQFEDKRSYRVESSKAEKCFSFKPTTTISSEVLKMKKMFIEHRLKNPDDSIYYNAMYIKDLVGNKSI